MTTQLPGAGVTLGGDFRIERQLGAGGMGAVYVAEQISTGRRRALKLMHPSLVSDAKLRERFEQEARVGARIASDHVVQVIAAGVDEASGSPFIAMELLDGEDLAVTIAKRGRLPPSDVQAILQPVCHALGAAHAVGIVHRDLKPENIFLLHTQDVQRSFDVKLLDFGIAKLTADARTMATSAVGTPMWMAPEQTDPRVKIAPTADVWPLGLLVFTMLTGRSYWRVASESNASVQALMREILFESVEPPSQRAVELQIDVPLPMGFDAWFMCCLDRDPAHRYSTAKEAWEALVPVLGAELRTPTQLVAMTTVGGAVTNRRMLEVAATAPVNASQAEMAATAPVSGLSGMEATVDASSLGSAAAARHTTGLSVGQTVPGPVVVPRSRLRTIGAIAAALVIAIVSWRAATVRAKHKMQAMQDKMEAASSSSETKAPSTALAPSVDVTPPVLPVASASGQVLPDAPLPSSTRAMPHKVTGPVKSAEPAQPKLPPFDAIEAQRTLDRIADVAKFRCRGLPGPRAFSITVTFAPSGRAISVKSSVFGMDQTVGCAQSSFHGATVAEFDPAMGNGVAAVGVSLD